MDHDHDGHDHDHGGHADQRAQLRALQRQAGIDPDRPQFDHEWQRRAFGVAVALSEFGYYPWEDFQRELIAAVARWEATPAAERAVWSYYDCWLEALDAVLVQQGMISREELDAVLLADG